MPRTSTLSGAPPPGDPACANGPGLPRARPAPAVRKGHSAWWVFHPNVWGAHTGGVRPVWPWPSVLLSPWSIDGITGPVDLNVFRGSLAELRALAGR
jgi:hypothetical protein